MKRHNRDDYYVVGEGILAFDRDGNATASRPSAAADMRKFRFSRLGPVGEPIDDARRLIFETVATAMTTDPAGGDPGNGARVTPATPPGSPSSTDPLTKEVWARSGAWPPRAQTGEGREISAPSMRIMPLDS